MNKNDFYQKLKVKLRAKLNHLEANYMANGDSKRQKIDMINKMIEGCDGLKHFRKKPTRHLKSSQTARLIRASNPTQASLSLGST